MEFFKKLLVPNNNKLLAKAAKEGNIKKIDQLIEAGANPNTYHGSYTPLQYCLIQHDKKNNCGLEPHYKKCAIKLLENGAKPDTDYKLEDFKLQRLIQVYAWAENLSLIRLLTIYGESSDNIKFRTEDSLAKKVFLSTKQLCDEKIKLENSLNNLSDDRNKNKIYKQLHEIWQTLSNEESDTIFKEHYQKKADYFEQLLNSPKEINQITSEKNTDNHLKCRKKPNEEYQPLLYNMTA